MCSSDLPQQRPILSALRASQRRLLANVSALAEINLGAAREARDASVERLARLAAEQDASRMHTVGLAVARDPAGQVIAGPGLSLGVRVWP